MQVERRPVGRGRIPVYHVGRSHLLEALHNDLQASRVCFADGAEARRAYAQLEALEPGMREGGIVYKCLPGQHDDLGISCAMLNWRPVTRIWTGGWATRCWTKQIVLAVVAWLARACPLTANLAVEGITNRPNPESRNARKQQPETGFPAKSNTCLGQKAPSA